MGVFDNFSKCVLIAFILILVAFLLDIIGFASPYWTSIEFFNMKAYRGLWSTCFKGVPGVPTGCSPITGGSAELQAVQAMEVIGFLCLIVAVVLIILYMFVMKDKKLLALVTLILCFLSGLFILIGVMIYGVNASAGLHFAFVFCILAAIVVVIAGVLLLMDYLEIKVNAV